MAEVLFVFACTTGTLLYLAPLLGLWIRYAVDWGRHALANLSGFGAGAAAVYIALFFLLSERGDARRTNLSCFALGGAALLFCAVGLDFLVGRSTFYNVLCCATACFASGAPGYNLPTVWREWSIASMPPIVVPVLAMFNAIASVLFNTVHVADIDWYIVFASGIAFLCALAQLVLHAVVWCLPPPLPRTGLRERFLDNENDDDSKDGHGSSSTDGDTAEESEGSTDRDDIRANGYDPDSERSSHHGELGDAEDEYVVHVRASSSDEEVADVPYHAAAPPSDEEVAALLLPPVQEPEIGAAA